MKSTFLNIGLCLLVTTVMLLLVEGVWRLVFDKGDQLRVFHPQMERVNPANEEWNIKTAEFKTSMRTNQHGFRGPELLTNKEGLKILFIGDSFVEAKQVDEADRFVEQAERLVTAQLNAPVVVRGLGIGGSDPARELLFYRHLGRSFEPDIVVQVFFLENDLMSPSERIKVTEAGQFVESITVEPLRPCNWKCLIIRHSRIAEKTYRLVQRLSKPPTDTKDQLDDFYWHTVAGQDRLKQENYWDVFRAVARTTAAEVRADGAQYLAVLMPSVIQVDPKFFEQYLAENPEIDQTWDLTGLHDYGKDLLEAEGIAVLDLMPKLQVVATDHPLYYYYNQHLTPYGNAVVGKALAEHLLKLLD